MALFQSLDGARQALADAQSTLARWEAKHTADTAELEQLQITIGEKALSDPRAADHLAAKDQALRSQISLATTAKQSAQAQILTRHREVLEAEAKHEDKQATASAKDRAKHDAKVKAALDALKTLNGADYRVQYMRNEHGVYKPEYGPEITTADQLQETADGHKYRAHVIREYLKTGQIHNNHFGLGDLPGLGKFNPTKHIPASVKAAKAAGLQCGGE